MIIELVPLQLLHFLRSCLHHDSTSSHVAAGSVCLSQNSKSLAGVCGRECRDVARGFDVFNIHKQEVQWMRTWCDRVYPNTCGIGHQDNLSKSRTIIRATKTRLTPLVDLENEAKKYGPSTHGEPLHVPREARSQAMGNVMPTIAPFEAAYAARPTCPSYAATLAVLTITPR